MEIKILVSDIDGTLLNDEREITNYTFEKLSGFMKGGGKIVLASGRAYSFMKDILKELGIKGVVVSYNGARIVDSETEEILYHNPLNSNITKKIIDFAKERGVHLNLYVENDWYVENADSDETEFYYSISGKRPVKTDFGLLKGVETTKALIFAENSILKKLEEELKELIGEEVDFTYSRPEFLEILSKGVNKGRGVQKALEILGISPDNCIAFGDELNDLEMLKFVKYGVAMENSNEKLKNEIVHKTLKNSENGVAKFLEDVIPNKEDSYLDILMKKTRSKRSFHNEIISSEKIDQIINSARFAGSARNAQEVRYLSINSREILDEIFPHTRWAGAIEWSPEISEGPSAYILLCSKKIVQNTDYLHFDMGLASQNILLKAKEQGYDSCILAAYNKEEINKIVELPEEYRSHYLIALGKGKEEVTIVPGIEGKLSYYRIGKEHFVPKLPFEKLIIKKI